MNTTIGSDAPIASSLVAYELNYHLVKNELLRGDLETRCRLIQALRWVSIQTITAQNEHVILAENLCFAQNSGGRDFSHRIHASCTTVQVEEDVRLRVFLKPDKARRFIPRCVFFRVRKYLRSQIN